MAYRCDQMSQRGGCGEAEITAEEDQAFLIKLQLVTAKTPAPAAVAAPPRVRPHSRCLLYKLYLDLCNIILWNLEVSGSRGRGRPKMTWRARLDGDMKDVGLRPEMAIYREKWRCGIMGRTSNPHKRGNNGR